LFTYNTAFVALAVSTMNLVQREFLLCEWLSFGISTWLFKLFILAKYINCFSFSYITQELKDINGILEKEILFARRNN